MLPDARVHAGLQRRQLQPVASVQRKLADLLFADQAAQAGVGQVHLRRFGVDRHLLLDRAEREVEIHGHCRADRDRDADTLAAGFGTVRVTWERLNRLKVNSGSGVSERRCATPRGWR